MKRKEFLKRACYTGTCMCGFGTLMLPKEMQEISVDEVANNNVELIQTWVTDLLSQIHQLEEGQQRNILKCCAEVHYAHLKMDDILAPFVGNLDGFIGFLESNWGWKVHYDREEKLIIADEQKTYCVCPVLQGQENTKGAAMCYCSEGFAEKMFEVVCQAPVEARVISSVRRGDSKCVYKIAMR